MVGGAREGEVMPYEMQWARSSFPVRFPDGIWRRMLPYDVEEIPQVAQPTSETGAT
jgi:hypothetical protein